MDSKQQELRLHFVHQSITVFSGNTANEMKKIPDTHLPTAWAATCTMYINANSSEILESKVIQLAISKNSTLFQKGAISEMAKEYFFVRSIT